MSIDGKIDRQIATTVQRDGSTTPVGLPSEDRSITFAAPMVFFESAEDGRPGGRLGPKGGRLDSDPNRPS